MDVDIPDDISDEDPWAILNVNMASLIAIPLPLVLKSLVKSGCPGLRSSNWTLTS
jgi:hypothetical protein